MNSNLPIGVPFKAKPNSLIDVSDLFSSAGHVRIDSGDASSLFKKVKSRLDKVVSGYDLHDDFIDDSAITNETDAAVVEEEKFKVILSLHPTESETKQKVEILKVNIIESLQPLIDQLDQLLFPQTNQIIQKIQQGNKKLPKITLTNQMLELVSQIVDEKVRLETENHGGGQQSKKNLQQWRKEALNYIIQKCFQVEGFSFLTFQKLSRDISQFLKKDDAHTSDAILPYIEPKKKPKTEKAEKGPHESDKKAQLAEEQDVVGFGGKLKKIDVFKSENQKPQIPEVNLGFKE